MGKSVLKASLLSGSASGLLSQSEALKILLLIAPMSRPVEYMDSDAISAII